MARTSKTPALVPGSKDRTGNWRGVIRQAGDRDALRRIPFGLGAPAGTPGAAERCLKCSFGNVPVIEEVIWTIPLPLTDTEIAETFGDIINVLGNINSPGAVPGVGAIDSTFVAPAVLQTDLWTMGIGIHIFCEPQSLTALGNGWLAPDTPTAPPPSPDVWTQADLVAGRGTGLSGLIEGTNFGAAILDWGDPTWRAAWHMANAYQFQWKTSQRELVINEEVADVAYMGSFADALAAGTSEVPVINYAQMVNAMYRAKQATGAAFIFLPANYRRVSSFNATPSTCSTNESWFHPTRDFDLAPTTWGGLRWQGYSCKGRMYREIENACFLERGIPISMSMVVNDPVHQARMQAAMSIDNETGAFNMLPDVNVTAFVNAGLPELTTTITGVGDTACNQIVTVARQVFKGGILKLAIKLKGWEMPGAWKQWCQQNIPGMFGNQAQNNPQLGT